MHSKAEAWEPAAELPLKLAAIVFLAAFVVPISWPDTPASVVVVCEALVWITWVIFAGLPCPPAPQHQPRRVRAAPLV